MKKKILSLLLIVLCFAVVLAACGKEEKKEKETREKPAATETEKNTESEPKNTESEPKKTEETRENWPDLDPEELCNADLEGDWLCDDGEMVLSFDGESRFWFADSADSMEGRYQFDGIALYLRDREGNVFTGAMTRDGNLTLDLLEGCFYPIPEEPELDTSLEGTWTYNFADIVYTFEPDGEVSCASPWDNYEGSYSFDGVNLEICKDGSTFETGHLEEDNRLYLDGLNGWFYTEGGISYVPLPEDEEIRLRPYCTPEKKRNPFADTVVFYNTDKGIYERVTADWVVAQGENTDIGDGRKQISLVGSCFIPYANVPDIEGPVAYGTTYYIYDRYTGLILTSDDFYLNEGGVYEYQFDSRDGRVVLMMDMDEEKTGPYGDCMDILSFIVTAHMPQWYDGLAVAVLPQPETYEEYAENIRRPDRPLGMSVIGSSIESALRFGIS